jgi:hypothetical protein
MPKETRRAAPSHRPSSTAKAAHRPLEVGETPIPFATLAEAIATLLAITGRRAFALAERLE